MRLYKSRLELSQVTVYTVSVYSHSPRLQRWAKVCVRLALTQVAEMGERVRETVHKGEHAGHLVEVDVLVQWEDGAEAVRARERYDVPQHHGDDERAREVQRLTCKQTQHVSTYMSVHIQQHYSNMRLRLSTRVCHLRGFSLKSYGK